MTREAETGNNRVLDELLKLNEKFTALKLEFSKLAYALSVKQEMDDCASSQRLPPVLVPVPKPFAGGQKQWPEFKAAVLAVLAVHPPLHPSKFAQVAFIKSHLTGVLLTWFKCLEATNDPLCRDPDALLFKLEAMYGNNKSHSPLQLALIRLKQGKGSCLTYSRRFCYMAAELEMLSSHFLLILYVGGLDEKIRDIVIKSDSPAHLDDLVNTCIEIEGRTKPPRVD